jgi:hypothetical protein
MLGAVAPLFATLGCVAVVVAVVVVVTKAIRWAGMGGWPGPSPGSGACWTFLLARPLTTGGTLENMTFWVAVGLVPLAIGLAMQALVRRQG